MKYLLKLISFFKLKNPKIAEHINNNPKILNEILW